MALFPIGLNVENERKEGLKDKHKDFRSEVELSFIEEGKTTGDNSARGGAEVGEYKSIALDILLEISTGNQSK